MFCADDPDRSLSQLVRGHIPACYEAQHIRRFEIKVFKHTAKELAKDKRIHDGGLVFGLDSIANRIDRHMFTIDLVGKIDLVGSAPVVIRAARPYGKAQSHRLQRTGLVSGNLEAFDLRSESNAVMADRLCGASTSLSQQISNTLAAANHVDRPQQSVSGSEGEPWLFDQSSLRTLHGESDGST